MNIWDKKKKIKLIALLKVWRDKKGISRRAVCDEIGLVERSLARWENGEGLPSNYYYAKVSDFLFGKGRDWE